MGEVPKHQRPTTPDHATVDTHVDEPARSPLAKSTALSTEVEVADPEAELDSDDSFTTRYDPRAKLGEGGMGEVRLCADRRIGREVALKVIQRARASRPEVRRRFLREARVQGQLEHPAIVPVYDLGRDPQGGVYFTMKRVRGRTLEEVIDAIRAGDYETMAHHPRHKLLNAFANVCLAVHFAHSRGVLHRDLKPGNVMLGDFGEVYVLDWGLAKVGLGPERAPLSERSRPVSGDSTLDPAHVQTQDGAVMGTPGYMAPEQIRATVDDLDARTDVYALGAILFELLTLVPLHGMGGAKQLMASTLVGADARPSVRAPDREVPPELEAICVRATAVEPSARFATAREMHDAIDAFVAGDRDVEHRRKLADEHARAAAQAAERALGGGDESVDERRKAMREVSRAVALDPSNEEALLTLMRLFTVAPRELPREARRELSAAHAQSRRMSAIALAVAYASWLLYLPLVFWMGVKNGMVGFACDALWIAAAIACALAARTRTRRRANLAGDSAMVLSSLALACAAGLFGPFVLLPGVAAANTIAFVTAGARSRRVASIVLGCGAILVPFVLERIGVVPPSMAFRTDSIELLPRIHHFPEAPTLVFLLLTNVAIVVTVAIFVARFRDALEATEEKLYFQTWQLRQFVPGAAYGAVGPRPEYPSATMPIPKAE
jgi:serine/threonine-protein kinase